jgi:hypothetical protein
MSPRDDDRPRPCGYMSESTLNTEIRNVGIRLDNICQIEYLSDEHRKRLTKILARNLKRVGTRAAIRIAAIRAEHSDRARARTPSSGG